MAFKNQSGLARTLYGTNAERLAISAADIDGKFVCFYETDLNSEYEWKGSEWVQTSIHGAVPVITMPGGVVHLREIDALDGTEQTLDWTGHPIQAVSIFVVPEAATTITPHTAVICVDPLSDLLRNLALTAGSSLILDSQRFPIVAGLTGEQFSFTSSITKIGIKRDIGASACRVFAIGVEA